MTDVDLLPPALLKRKAVAMLDTAACAGMKIGEPHVSVEALADLDRLRERRRFGRVAAFKSEPWPASFRNGGRHQILCLAGMRRNSQWPANSAFFRLSHAATTIAAQVLLPRRRCYPRRASRCNSAALDVRSACHRL